MRKPALLLACLPLSALAAPAKAPVDRHHDEHSYAEPDKVVVKDLGLDLRVDFAKKELHGSADLALQWKDAAYRRLVLDTRDLTIEKVLGKSGDGGWHKLAFDLAPRDPIFGQKLSIEMKRQYEIVRVRYRTSPEASGLQWLEPSMTQGKKLPFMFSQSQAIHARSWVPLQDTPGVRYTYTAHIETEPEVMALMSADNPPDASRDGDYVFRMSQPIPSYLMAISAGDLVFKPISERAGVWAEPATVDAAVAEFADTEKMIQTTEQLYGPYRWERYDLLILPPSFPFGGMENPRLSFITPTVIVGDKSLVSLIAHELAHSWSGNLVTNASAKDMWLNEGFTSYVENRIVESMYGKERSDMEDVISQFGLMNNEMKELPKDRQRLVLSPLVGVDPDEALTDVAYVKGAWFLQFLEQRFGRETFDAFLRSYFNEFAFQSITSDQFVEYLTKNLLPKNAEAVNEEELDAWLNKPGIPKFAQAARSARFDTVDQAREDFLRGRKAAGELATSNWTTQEWVRFVEGMPETVNPEQLVELDNAFHFTNTPNGEIAQRWYPLTVRSGYFEARPAIAQFLGRIGRRKLIMPTYEALAASKEGREFARKVYAEAKPGYHPITRATVEAALADPKR
jgi:leukotriene-A4 hydrolase